MSTSGPGAWSAIELRHLVALRAVAGEGSFRRAAQRLGYVQSTVSQQIAALETLTGERLVERARGTHSVGLTEAGRALLTHAYAVVERMQEAQAELAALHAHDGTVVRVGRVDRAASALVPQLIANLRRTEPAITVVVEDVATVAALLERIELHELDVGICPLPLARGAFEAHELYRDRLVAVVDLQSNLARRRRPLSVEELGALPLVGSLTLRPWVEARMRAAAVNPSFVLRCDDDAVLQQAAAAGVGVAILPSTAAASRDGVAVIDLRPEIAAPPTGIVHSRRRNDDVVIAALVDAARAVWSTAHRTDRAVSLAVAGERA
jgi:molybdate transport repressor ModE-like protein